MLVVLLFDLGYPDHVVRYYENSGMWINCSALWRMNREDTLFKKYCDESDTVGASSVFVPTRPRSNVPPPPKPPPGVEWYQYPDFQARREIPFEFRVLSTKYIPDTPTTYKQMYGDGDVFVIKNPHDTSVYVSLVWMRVDELEPLIREYWYGDVKEIFFSVKIQPPLKFPEDKRRRVEIDSALIRLVFYLPDLPRIDSLLSMGDQVWIDFQTPLRMIRLFRCMDSSGCAMRVTHDVRTGHIDGVMKPTASVGFILAPHDSVVVYVSPIYGR